jgi:uncharacterized membrane protein YedE/YeeE
MKLAHLVTLLAGALFALGLGVGGMTQPSKVIGFLDVAGAWDPSLAFVMMGAIGVGVVPFRFVLRRSRPLLGGTLHVPRTKHVDARLVLGAALFGVGWGLGGYCPGPALVSLVTGQAPVLIFVAAMAAGIGVQHLVDRQPKGASDDTTDAEPIR